MNGVVITGDKALDRVLATVGRKVRPMVRKAQGKQARIVAKAVKAAVPGQYKGVRASVGHRTTTDKATGRVGTKVGFGVGKSRSKKAAKRSSTGGVGIARPNVHWWVMGTDERVTADGVSRGAMPEMGRGIVAAGAMQTKSEQLNVLATSIRADLAKLRAKR